MQFIIISGRSGSGKTVALHALEDLGFYCIDNLPISLLPMLGDEISYNHKKVAVSIDSRNLPVDLAHFKDMSAKINKFGKCDILYLDASENILLQRFSETRRKHPLTDKNTSLREAIRQEHKLLMSFANLANFTLDTSQLNQHELQHFIRQRSEYLKVDRLHLLLQSFGFKHGLPPESDFVFDVRCLPNPYWKPGLRALTGLDADVMRFLEEKLEVGKMLTDITDFIQKWIPQFQKDNRSYITIAVGCTGGHHRSVYLAEKIANNLQHDDLPTQVRHRDLK
jgi:RNase adapter protein RapZ